MSTESYALSRYVAAGQLYDRGMLALTQMPELQSLAGRNVCIAGCTGLIGNIVTSVLALANQTILNDNPIQIYGVARHTSSLLPHASPWFHFIELSVSDPALYTQLPICDYFFYIAGAASDYLSRTAQIIDTQAVGLELALEHAGEAKGFTYISSTRVYGRASGDMLIDEDMPARVQQMHLDNIYDAHKWFGEALCLYYRERRGCPANVVRISNIYGTHHDLRSETVLTDFTRQALQTHQIRLRGNPRSVRNHCSVLDIVQGLVKALVHGQPGRAYNLASREHLETQQLAALVASVFPYAVEVILPSADLPISIQRLSIDRAEKELGYSPYFTFAEISPVAIYETALAMGTSLVEASEQNNKALHDNSKETG